MYQEIRGEQNELLVVVRLVDNVNIPINLNNADYKEYLDWVNEGNSPIPDPNADLTAFQKRALEIVREEARYQIEDVGGWKPYIQQNASDGMYIQAIKDNCLAYRSSIISQCNVVENSILATLTISNVLAIQNSIVWDTTGLFTYEQSKV